MEEWDIKYKELLSMPEQSYRLIDIRDEASMSYGMIPGAEWLPTETIEQNLDAADKEKKLVLYCTRGALSEERRHWPAERRSADDRCTRRPPSGRP